VDWASFLSCSCVSFAFFQPSLTSARSRACVKFVSSNSFLICARQTYLNLRKAPFEDLLPSIALQVDASWIGLHLSRAHVSLLPFSIPLSLRRDHVHVLSSHLQILSWSVPMLPSALVSGSCLNPRCQVNLLKSQSWPNPGVWLILTSFQSQFIRNCYRLVFYKSWKRIREKGNGITVIHGRLAGLILK